MNDGSFGTVGRTHSHACCKFHAIYHLLTLVNHVSYELGDNFTSWPAPTATPLHLHSNTTYTLFDVSITLQCIFYIGIFNYVASKLLMCTKIKKNKSKMEISSHE